MEHWMPLASSRAAMTEVERQRMNRVPRSSAAGGGSGDAAEKEGQSGKGQGRKDDVQRKPEDQKGNANPEEGEGRKAP